MPIKEAEKANNPSFRVLPFATTAYWLVQQAYVVKFFPVQYYLQLRVLIIYLNLFHMSV